jgi:vesicle coat complex subunit
MNGSSLFARFFFHIRRQSATRFVSSEYSNCEFYFVSQLQVVMALTELYVYLAPRVEVALVMRSLVHLLLSKPREIQYIVLQCIMTISRSHAAYLEPHIKLFCVTHVDPQYTRVLKLEILTQLATEANIGFVLSEFQSYLKHADKSFVTATIQVYLSFLLLLLSFLLLVSFLFASLNQYLLGTLCSNSALVAVQAVFPMLQRAAWKDWCA